MGVTKTPFLNSYSLFSAITMTHLQRINYSNLQSKATQTTHRKKWWGPIWRGLFVDPAGKHYRVMGRALWLYGYFIVHADRRTGILYRKVETIARDMKVSRRTVQAWLALLRQHGYIRTRSTGRAVTISIEKWRPIIKSSAKADSYERSILNGTKQLL